MSLSDPECPESVPPTSSSRMPLRLMRLEERIVLDAAGVAESAPDSDGPDAAVDHSGPNSLDVLGAEAANPADGAGDAAGGALERAIAALLDLDNQQEASQRVLAISSDIEQADGLAAATTDGVVSIVFDAQDATLDSLLQQIRDVVGGTPAESIALATHGSAGGFELVTGHTVNLETLQNPEMRTFWSGLAELLQPDGRIDLLACDAAEGAAGQALVDTLEDLTGVNFAASIDDSGNAAQGGDWVLETDGIPADAVYFDSERVSAFAELLANPPTINDTDPGNTAQGGGSPVVVDAGITVTAGDTGDMQGAAVRIQSGFLASQDQLSFDSSLAGSYGIAGSYDASTGELLLSGTASTAEYQQVLRTVTYQNTSLTPDLTPRGILFVIGDDFDGYRYNAASGHYYELVDDLIRWSQAGTAADASALHGLQGYLSTVTSAAENGFVTGLIAGGQQPWLGGSDAGGAEGNWSWMTGPEAGTQFWQGGLGGSPFGGIYANWDAGEPDNASNSDYLIITSTGLWQDAKGNTDHRYVVEYGGMDADAEGQLAAGVTVSVVGPNNAPVLDNAGEMSLTPIAEDDVGNAGSTVAGIIASAGGDRITDADGDPEGIAVTAIDNTHGTWQYSTNGGGAWNDIGAVANDNALLLRDTDLVRFQPDSDWNGTVADGLAFRAWDQTSGAPGSYADTTINGGNTAFSTALEAAALTVNNVNDSPTVTSPLVGQAAAEDASFAYQFAADTFSDVDVGDVLSYGATLNDGSPLPDWLTFDAATRTFSGTPSNADVGSFIVKVAADDGQGGIAWDTFVITVTNTNDAPTVANPLVDQVAPEDAQFTYRFAPDTFSDVDAGDVLSYNATLGDGSPLPDWLIFDPATRTFSGTPGNADVGTFTVKVAADDGHGGIVWDTFVITVTNTNDAPTVANPLVDQGTAVGSPLAYQFSADTFVDEDPGDRLSYSARLADGSSLPSWLIFDPLTRTFSGTPSGADAGTLTVKVTADDGHGGQVSDTFAVTVSGAEPPAAPDPPSEPEPPPRHNAGSSNSPSSAAPGTPAESASPAADDGSASTADDGSAAGSEGGEAADSGDAADAGDAGDAADAGSEVSSSAGGADSTASGAVADAGGPNRAGQSQGRDDVGYREREEELEVEAGRLTSQISSAMFSGELLADASQPSEFREAWSTILGAYVDSSEEVSAYLHSAFRAVSESAVLYQETGQSVDALRRELAQAAQAGIDVNADALLAGADEARADVKSASAQLEAAIQAAAQAGKDERFDRVLEDVVSAALQRLMRANERLFVESQALSAAAAALSDARVNGKGAIDDAQIASATAQARQVAQAQITEMRASWDQVAQDVFSAFVARLAGEYAAGDAPTNGG